MARVVRFHQFGGPEVLRIESIQPLKPGPGEVQIRIMALGLNRAEALLRSGTYIERPVLPSGLGLEAAGLVEAVGADVSGFTPGEAVSIIPPISMVKFPTYSDLASFPAEIVVKHPTSLSWESAASLWMPYLTAYGALIDIANVSCNDFVVITAASSSVGIAAIQIARMVGAIPIAVTRTSAKAQALYDVGAAHVVASAEEDLESRLKEITGANGVRVIFDPVGGPSFEPLTAAMAKGGILIEYGGLSKEPTPFPLFTVLAKSLTLRGYLVHEITGDPARLENAKKFIFEGLASGVIQPIVAQVFPLEQIVEAHRFMESNEQFGKVVVMP